MLKPDPHTLFKFLSGTEANISLKVSGGARRVIQLAGENGTFAADTTTVLINIKGLGLRDAYFQ